MTRTFLYLLGMPHIVENDMESGKQNLQTTGCRCFKETTGAWNRNVAEAPAAFACPSLLAFEWSRRHALGSFEAIERFQVVAA